MGTEITTESQSSQIDAEGNPICALDGVVRSIFVEHRMGRTVKFITVEVPSYHGMKVIERIPVPNEWEPRLGQVMKLGIMLQL